MAIMFDAQGGVHTLRHISDEWQALNVQIRDVVNQWSSRTDLMTYIGPDAGRGIAPALFSRLTKEIDLNTDVAFGKGTPASIIEDFRKRKTQYQWVRAAGLVMHESMHAQYTTSDWNSVYEGMAVYGAQRKDVWDAFQNLEESRIEKRGVEKFPDNRPFLRGSALYLVDVEPSGLGKSGADVKALRNAADIAVQWMSLGLARVDAGVLDKGDVREISKIINEIVELPLRKKFRRIWREFHGLNDWDPVELEKMVELSKEWADLLQEVRDSLPPQEGDSAQQEAESLIGRLLRALLDDQSSTGLSAQTEAAQQERDEEALVRLKADQEDRDQQEANKSTAQEVFPRGHGTTYHSTKSQITEERPPTLEERKMAVSIAKAFEKAKYRDRVVTARMTRRPPGRLNTGLAMQGRAIKSGGGHSTVEPWKTVNRKHVEDPSLRLGIMGDISGSMSRTMPAMGTATWVMQEAARRIKGRVASVYYGGSVFSVLKPGEHQDRVTVYSAPDNSHSFDKAFRALDGGLELLNGTGARLLIINSDGDYGGDETAAVIKWLNQCRKKGVAVVWLGLRPGANEELCQKTGATYVPVPSAGGVLAAAEAIGKACTLALNGASRG